MLPDITGEDPGEEKLATKEPIMPHIPGANHIRIRAQEEGSESCSESLIRRENRSVGTSEIETEPVIGYCYHTRSGYCYHTRNTL